MTLIIPPSKVETKMAAEPTPLGRESGTFPFSTYDPEFTKEHLLMAAQSVGHSKFPRNTTKRIGQTSRLAHARTSNQTRRFSSLTREQQEKRFIQAIQDGRIERVRIALEADPSLINRFICIGRREGHFIGGRPAYDYQKPIAVALINTPLNTPQIPVARMNILRLLLESGADLNTIVVFYGSQNEFRALNQNPAIVPHRLSVIAYICKNGARIANTRLLFNLFVENGMDVNRFEFLSEFAQNVPRYHRGNAFKYIDLFLENGADINRPDEDGRRILDYYPRRLIEAMYLFLRERNAMTTEEVNRINAEGVRQGRVGDRVTAAALADQRGLPPELGRRIGAYLGGGSRGRSTRRA